MAKPKKLTPNPSTLFQTKGMSDVSATLRVDVPEAGLVRGQRVLLRMEYMRFNPKVQVYGIANPFYRAFSSPEPLYDLFAFDARENVATFLLELTTRDEATTEAI